jgi:hypothetical protein
MKTLGTLLFAWLVPGGGYLLERRLLPFAMCAGAVAGAFVAGLALHGSLAWPGPADVAGLDGFTALMFRAGALARTMAGGPYLLAQLLGATGPFVDGRLHEYGTTLLTMGGVCNALAAAAAFDLRKGRAA